MSELLQFYAVHWQPECNLFDFIEQNTNICLYLLPPSYTNCYLKSDEIKKNEMDGAYGMYAGGVSSWQGFNGESWAKEKAWKTVA